MASVTFRRLANRGRQQVWRAVFSRLGENLPKLGTRYTGAEMQKPRPGRRGYFPRGTDRGAA